MTIQNNRSLFPYYTHIIVILTLEMARAQTFLQRSPTNIAPNTGIKTPEVSSQVPKHPDFIPPPPQLRRAVVQDFSTLCHSRHWLALPELVEDAQ